MHAGTQKFNKSLTHALVMDIIWGLLVSIYYSLLLLIGVWFGHFLIITI